MTAFSRRFRLPAAALLLSSCTLAPPTVNPRTASAGVGAAPTTSSSAAPSSTRVFSLLANNHLLVASIASGAVLGELTLGAASAGFAAHPMALDRDGRTLFVLINAADAPTRIAVVDTASLKATATLDPGAGLDYRGLAVGPRTGRLFLFANQRGDAVVRVIDPSGVRGPQTWLARAADGRNWLVYQGAISSDESALYLSYHGPDTTGIDRFTIQTTALVRCGIPSRPESGCFRTHGAFVLHFGELIAAAGDGLVLLDPVTGAQRAQVDFKLEGNHLMEFGIAVGARRAYAVGSCGYSGGLATVDLATEETRVLAPSRSAGVICGERIAALDDGSLLVIARTAIPAPSLAPGALVVVGSSDGTTLRTIKTSAEPVDLVLF
jgi:DNA-binding beta-propeller fold protein YncE